MKLTRAAEYAVRCILYLSGRPAGQVASRREVSSAMDIPGAFLSKIAQALSRAGILIVRQGAAGGYELALSPKNISLLSVVEAVDGEIQLNECLLRPHECGRSGLCAVHEVWHKARNQLRETLHAVDFETLARTAPVRDPRQAARRRDREDGPNFSFPGHAVGDGFNL